MEHEKINCPYAEEIGGSRSDIANIKATVSRIEALVERQNGRVRKLENWRAYTIGIVTAIVFIVDLFFREVVK